VLGPFITWHGLPVLDGRKYPDWLPHDEITIGLIFGGLLLFLIGFGLTLVGLFGRR